MKNKTLNFVLLLGILMSFALISGHGEEEFAQAEDIIMQKIPCSELTDIQLEILGDYYMELMHPGELHEIMDERLGGEGSEKLRQVHINMGLSFYCGQHQYTSTSFMNTMMGRNYGMPYGMMGYNYGYGTNYATWIFNALLIIGIVLLIVWIALRQSRKKK